MAGPPYLRYPSGTAPGQNSIGQFQIGVSPLGTIAPFDPWTTIISQYADSPILTSLITSFNAAVDQTENIDNLYDMIWNIQTAQGYGLDVWGRIVGVIRTVTFPTGASYLGFQEAGSSFTGFGQGGLYSGGQGLTTNYLLTDYDFRNLILAKAAGNISNGSIQALNSILLGLFPGRGSVYVADNQNMSLTLTFPFVLTAVQLAIISLSGVLPIPAGVVVNISQP
jgi:hypothetical protein